MIEQDKSTLAGPTGSQTYEAPTMKVVKLDVAVLGGGGGSGDNQAPGTGFD